MNRCFYPNLLTLLGFSSGIFAVYVVFQGAYLLGGVFFLAAALIDRYDGKLARALGCASEFGARLDTISDIGVFLIAIAVAFSRITPLPVPIIAVLMSLYVLFGCFRLWRFHQLENLTYNIGLPVTVAGPSLYGLSLLVFLTLSNQTVISLLQSAFVLLAMGLMVARFKIKR